MKNVCSRNDMVVVLRSRTGAHRRSGATAVLRSRYCAAPTVTTSGGEARQEKAYVLEPYRPGVSETGVDARHGDVVVL